MSKQEPRISRYASGTSDESLARALDDQRILERARMRASDQDARYTAGHLSKTHYDALRMDRDDLDFREWSDSRGFWGIDRTPTGPGVLTEGQRRRARLRAQIDDGF